jgi:diguanylate cyclase (GGDEF)-like protein/PAS domain S-box-containing protein
MARGLVGRSSEISGRGYPTGDGWFTTLVEHGGDLILVVDGEGGLRYVSPAVTTLLGYRADELVGHNWLELIDAADASRLAAGTTAVARIRRKDGSWCDVEAVTTDARDDPAIGGLVVNARDVTERRRAEAQQAEETELLGMIVSRAPLRETLERLARMVERHADVLCSVLLVGPDGYRLQVGAAPSLPQGYVAALDGMPVDDLLKNPVFIADIAAASHFEVPREVALNKGVRAWWSMPVSGPDDEVAIGVVALHCNRPRLPSKLERRLLERSSYLAGIAIERDQAEQRMAHQALHDPLTGLPNRQLFLDRLGQALERAGRRRSDVTVLLADLDRFKVVNDSLGHEAGDRLLVAVANRILGSLRPGELTARFGGDEFVVLSERASGKQEAIAIADRLNESLRAPFVLDGREVHVSASIGIARPTRANEPPEALLRDADTAMYRAKDRGRSRHQLFDDTMRARAMDRLDTEDALRRAVSSGQLRVVYQPVISLTDERVTGVEALVRWAHPSRGLLNPVDFISVAEETGLIVPLGAWVLEEACRQARRWCEQVPGYPEVDVSVNLSGGQISQPDVAAMVESVLKTTGVSPEHLCLEITESVLMEDAEPAITTLRSLKALGVRLAIDDFGTGYSSLNYLKRFPIDVLKVDRSFVDGLGVDHDDSAIVSAVISMAHALGLEAVAEGVTSAAQVAELRVRGCDQAQGYYFATPLPAEQLTRVFRQLT